MSRLHKILLLCSLAAFTVCCAIVLIFFLNDRTFFEHSDVFDPIQALQSLSSERDLDPSIALENIIAKTIQSHGTQAAFEVIEAGIQQGIISNDVCHSLLHYVGHAAFSENPDDFDALLNIVGGTTCIGGFLHGIEAEMVLTSPNVIADVQRFCSFQIQKGVKPGPCYHGVGHAAAEMTDYDVPASLALCDALEGGPEHDLRNCYRGVFSEVSNVVEGYDGHTGIQGEKMTIPGLDAENPYTYCETFDSKYQSSCKSQLTRLFSLKNMDTWVEVCSTAGDIRSISICLNISAGVFVRDSLSFSETTKFPAAFESLPFEYKKPALLGAAEAFAGYFQDYRMKDWETFCSTLAEADAQQYCTETFDLLLHGEAKPWDLFDRLYNELG